MSATVPAQLDRVQSFLSDVFRLEAPITDDPELALRAAEHVSGNDRLTPAEQADIYRRQFFLRHVDSLMEDHAGIVHYLGEEAFEDLARAYLAAHPPRTSSLRDLGADIATFAAKHPGVPDELRELIVDMARYELCIIDIFDAADVPPPDRERLRAVPQEAWLTEPLVLTPHLHLLDLGYPAPELRKAIKAGEASREPPPRAPVCYGVFRHEDVITFHPLSREAYDLLRLLQAGEPLTSACEALAAGLTDERASMVEAEVGIWFQTWASWGWILDVKTT